MPIYEYKCSSCGHKQEILQKLADAPLTECAACGKAALNKLISAAGFQLKGSGWYATDFKGGAKPAKDKEGDGAAAQSKPAEAGTAAAESKPKEEGKSKKEIQGVAKSDAPASSAGAGVAEG